MPLRLSKSEAVIDYAWTDRRERKCVYIAISTKLGLDKKGCKNLTRL